MTKRFVIATDTLGDDEVRALQANFKEGVGWWYWLPNFWLVVDPFDSLTTETINGWIHKINSKVRAVVIQVEHKDWAACTKPDGQGRDMAEWLNTNWTNMEI